MTEKLNPCRKCGKQPQVDDISYKYHGWDDHAHWVICPRTCGNTGEIGESDSEAIRFWNAANPIASQPAEKIDLAKFEGCTPGPWKAEQGIDDEPDRWQVLFDGPKQWHIATIENGQPGDTLKTEGVTARLIAAAPDLLAEVKQNRGQLEVLRQINADQVTKLRSQADLIAQLRSSHDRAVIQAATDLARLRQQVEEMRDGLGGMVDDYVNQHGHHDQRMCFEDGGGCPYCEATAILAKHAKQEEVGNG